MKTKFAESADTMEKKPAQIGKLILFFILNFGALGLGSILIGDPQNNPWYNSQNKAPWTPPGWVFGAAWSTIMLCFSFFMWKAARLLSSTCSDEDVSSSTTFVSSTTFYALFALQWVLNVGWNPIFFRLHQVTAGLLIISALTILVGWFTYWGFRRLGNWGVLMLPYLIWLLIATSLNAYILLNN